jgi:hypothetical protein
MNMPGFTAEAALALTSHGHHMVDGRLENIWPTPNQVMPQQLSLPIYGNYCGPGHGDPTGRMPPIDAVDAVCRAHDLCYDNRGYFNCRCDRNLITSMPGAIANTPTAVGKGAGAAVLSYFANAACVCRNRVCVPVPFVGTRCTTVTTPGFGGVGAC